ncbi:MAG: phosphate acyltransferase PlsX [Rubellimicrobium sp.]|nr:phosphate acyltransferase PlsX [Rubellimicrobium sp.]
MNGAAPGTATGDDADGIVLSVDAMGGDKGPSAVVGGLELFFAGHPRARILLHGQPEALEPLLAGKYWAPRVGVVAAPAVVTMSDKPSQIMRRGRDTSMWSAIESVRDGRAAACISCGNTGALMAVSMLVLRKAEGVNRPAIAALWPSMNPGGFNVMLDAGADIRADQNDLLTYALMGVAYARTGLAIARPRVGLLNVGTEEHKGRAELKVAHDLIGRAAARGDFAFAGFVEGGDLLSDRIDVVVTDGFTGNVAIKTAEGTSRLITGFLREAFLSSLAGRLAGLLGRGALGRLRARVDPRRVNGGVFLGLNGTVIKSHGGADATGIAAALDLAWRLASAGFAEKLARQVAQAVASTQDAAPNWDAAGTGALPAGMGQA